MPSATILIADGSEEIEFVTPYDVLVRAGFETKSVGVGLLNIYATCSRNIKIVPDTTAIPSTPESDVLVLPGGAKGAETFCASVEVQRLIRAYRDSGRWVAFICAATTALVESVKSEGKTEGLESANAVKVTSHPSVKDGIVEAGWTYAPDNERVVVDGKVITSRGPGTAMLFALTIVEALAGKAKREEISPAMLLAAEL